MIYAILIGALAGFLAGKILKGSGYGALGNIVIGIIGGFVGSFVFGLIGLMTTGVIGDIIAGTAGAVLLLLVFGRHKASKD